MTESAQPHWPYPRWVAHRGAGKLAPENTLAAFKLGAAHGWRMFECDVKLSRDDQPFLLHDDTLERTTNGAGTAGELSWAALQLLDAGSWHSPAYAGQALPSLSTVAQYCLANSFDLNIEIKPTLGTEGHTGRIVAQHAAQLWRGAPQKPLLTSFQPDALDAARSAAPDLPRGLLLSTLPEGWLARALALGCSAIVCQHTLWDAATTSRAKNAGLKLLSYTVNDAQEAVRLWALGVDGLITDRVDAFGPAA